MDNFVGTSLNTNVWADKPVAGVTGDWMNNSDNRGNYANGQREYARPAPGDTFIFTGDGLTMRAIRENTFISADVNPLNQAQGITYAWASASIVSLQTFTNAWAEIRCKFPSPQGFQPAFWTWGKTSGHGSEIDAPEFYSVNHFQVALASFLTGSSGSTEFHNVVPDLTADYHTYGFEVFNNQVKFYLDGVLIKTESGNTPSAWNLITYLTVSDDGSVTGTQRVQPNQTVQSGVNSVDMPIDYIAVWTRS